MPTGWKKVINTEETKSTNSNKPPEQTSTNKSSDQTTEINRMEMFIPENTQRSLDNLIVPSTVKNRIDTALNRIKYHDILYHQWNPKRRRLGFVPQPNNSKVLLDFTPYRYAEASYNPTYIFRRVSLLLIFLIN
ncbi:MULTISPECIES: hypothetical protein [Okeania]|nr:MULTISPECIES: hypothetical protein [Okeania]NES78496.1 hypothetical protein [Okeania sp. SIO1H4]NET96151.1 hypothetical protein [Okeania sp. SIO1H2]RQH04011.1 hypothetical protein D4Z78_31500 [Okeania hirsuta]